MFKKILLGIAVNALALAAVTYLLPDLQYTGGIKFFIVGGVIIGFMNAFIKPLMKLLSLPIVFLTLGLFSLVINVIIFWLTIKVINGINFSDVSVTVSSVVTYIIGAFIFTVVNWILHLIIRNK